jgi:HEAT repeat protein
LRQQRPEDFAALQSLLTTTEPVPPDFRTKALYALGLIGDPSVVPLIRGLLPQLDERGRMSALSALGQLATPEAVAAIIEHAEEPSPQVRKVAVQALRRSATSEARQKLDEIAVNDPVDWVRNAAARGSD